MRKYKLLKVNLNLFNGAAGGAGAAGAVSGPGGDGSSQAAESALPKAETQGRPGSSRRAKSGAFDNVVFGKQEDASGIDTTTSSAAGRDGEGNAKRGISTTSDALEAKRQAFKEMIEGEYKDIYSETFQQAFNRRFKESKGMEQSLEAQKPIMDILAQRYNVADGDPAKLLAAIEQDNSYWESAAEQSGLTVEQYKAMKKLERENAEFQRAQQRQQNQQKAQQQLATWMQEAEQVKEEYASFDLETEMGNKDFVDLLKLRMPMKKAYELVHMDEIKAAAAKTAAQTAGQQMAAKIQSKAARPKENGTSSQSAVIVKSDVHSLSKEDRAEQARRALRGEKIKW